MNISLLFVLFLVEGHVVKCGSKHKDASDIGLCRKCVSNGICKESGSCTPGTEHGNPSGCGAGDDCCTPVITPCKTDVGIGVCASNETCNDENKFFKIENVQTCKNSVCCVPKLVCSPTPGLFGACIKPRACNEKTSVKYVTYAFCKTTGLMCCVKRPVLNKPCFASEAAGKCKQSGMCIKDTEKTISDNCAIGLDCCLPAKGIGAPCSVHLEADSWLHLDGSCNRDCGDDAEYTNSNCNDGLKCCVKPRGLHWLCANNAGLTGSCSKVCGGRNITCTRQTAKICSIGVCCDYKTTTPVAC
ncbi:Uncharacterised protein g8751 [Pycnogonum litorale]